METVYCDAYFYSVDVPSQGIPQPYPNEIGWVINAPILERRYRPYSDLL
jgi:hypothetical protein